MKALAGKELEAFRKLDAVAQLAQLRGLKEDRNFQVERDTIDEAKRTAWFSIASERPYERWWGVEILDHGKKSIRTERLDEGANFLVGHDTSDVVGVVEKWEISSDKKLRILVRFGRSARAEEIFRDVLDGIRRNTSVGYIIHDLILEKSEEGVNTYRVTDWEVLEGSLVAVPADPSVGQGRNLEVPPTTQRTLDMNDEEKKKFEAELRAKIEAEVKTKADAEAKAKLESQSAAETLKREQQRVSDLLAAGDLYKDLGGAEIARECIKDANASVETFKARMADRMHGKSKPIETAEPGQEGAQYGEGVRVRYRYGRLRSFTRDLPLENGKVLKAEEAAYRSGQWVAAVVYNSEKAKKWCADRGIDTQLRVMTEGVNSAGGAIVPDELETAIIDLRDEYGVARQLARVRPMGSDSRTIPRRTGGITAYFVNEDNDGVTASDKGWDNVGLNAKTLAALGLMSNQYVEDAIIDVADDFAGEMALAFATKEDDCFLIADGTSTYGGMRGLVHKFEATAYASRVDAASTHDTPAEIDGTDLANTMGSVRKYAKRGSVWICSSTYSEVIFGRLKQAAGGNTMTDLAGRPVPSYLGYPIIESETMLSALTAQNDKVLLMFGNFNLSSSFGARRGITVQILRERYAEKLQIGVLGSERFDIVNHDLGSTTVKGPVAALLGTT